MKLVTKDSGVWNSWQVGNLVNLKLNCHPHPGFGTVETRCYRGLAQGMVSAWGNWSSVTGMRPCITSGFNGCWFSLAEKAMAAHSGTLAWRIPWTDEPGGLQPMGSWSVGHDWATSLSLFTLMHWRRQWRPTPVFLPGESQGRGSLVSCRLWGRTASDTTETT